MKKAMNILLLAVIMATVTAPLVVSAETWFRNNKDMQETASTSDPPAESTDTEPYVDPTLSTPAMTAAELEAKGWIIDEQAKTITLPADEEEGTGDFIIEQGTEEDFAEAQKQMDEQVAYIESQEHRLSPELKAEKDSYANYCHYWNGDSDGSWTNENNSNSEQCHHDLNYGFVFTEVTDTSNSPDFSEDWDDNSIISAEQYYTDNSHNLLACFMPLVVDDSGGNSASTNWNKFSTAQKANMSMAAAYGYNKYELADDDGSYSDKDRTWGSATQNAVWYYGGYTVKMVYAPTSDTSYMETYNAKLSEIKNYVAKFNTKPSFMNGATHTLNYNGSTGYFEVKLTDTNAVLDSYWAPWLGSGASGGCRTYNTYYQLCDDTSKANSMIIKTNNWAATQQTVTIKPRTLQYYDSSPNFLEQCQDKVSGSYSPPTTTMTLKIAKPKGYVDIYKVDEFGVPIPGMQFNMYDYSDVDGDGTYNEKVGTCTTDANGYCRMHYDNGTTEYLVPDSSGAMDDYYITEVDNPNDAFAPMVGRIDINMYSPTSGSTPVVTPTTYSTDGTPQTNKVENYYSKGDPIDFTTVDCLGNNIGTSSGGQTVQYQVYNASNNTTNGYDGQPLPVVTTNSSGVATIPSLLVGDYYLLQINNTSNNIIEDHAANGSYGQKFYFHVGPKGSGSNTFNDGYNMCTGTTAGTVTAVTDSDLYVQNLVVSDKPLTFTTVDCRSTDIASSTGGQTVSYQIYNATTNTTTGYDGKTLPIVTSNSTGVITTPNLVVGNYYLMQTSNASDLIIEDNSTNGAYGQKFYFTMNGLNSTHTFDDGLNMCTGTTTGSAPTAKTDSDLYIQNLVISETPLSFTTVGCNSNNVGSATGGQTVSYQIYNGSTGTTTGYDGKALPVVTSNSNGVVTTPSNLVVGDYYFMQLSNTSDNILEDNSTNGAYGQLFYFTISGKNSTNTFDDGLNMCSGTTGGSSPTAATDSDLYVQNFVYGSTPMDVTTVGCIDGNSDGDFNIYNETGQTVQYQIYNAQTRSTTGYDGKPLPIVTTDSNGVAHLNTTDHKLVVGDYYLMELNGDNVIFEDTTNHSVDGYGQEFEFTITDNTTTQGNVNDGYNMCTGTTTISDDGSPITATTDEDLYIQNSVDYTWVSINSVYAEMNNQEITVEWSTDGLVPENTSVNVVVTSEHNGVETEIIKNVVLTPTTNTGTVINYTTKIDVALATTIIDSSDTIKVEIYKDGDPDNPPYFNNDLDNDGFRESLTVQRYYPSNDVQHLSLDAEGAVYSDIGNPLAERVCRSGFTSAYGDCNKEYFETIYYVNSYTKQTVSDGVLEVGGTFSYDSACPTYTDSPTDDDEEDDCFDFNNDTGGDGHLYPYVDMKMYQPMPDSTFQFEQVHYENESESVGDQDYNYYEIDLVWNYQESNSDQSYGIENFYGEVSNGRFYKANTEKIDNPTTDQTKLEEGYVDKNDILVAPTSYPLSMDEEHDIDGNGMIDGEEDIYDREWTYYIEIQNIGYNSVDVVIADTFTYDSAKTSSFDKDTGIFTPIGTNANVIDIGPYNETDSYVKTCDASETIAVQEFYQNHPEYHNTYVSTELLGVCESYQPYPELEGVVDDYYLDYGDYGGNGLYETNYIGNDDVVQIQNTDGTGYKQQNSTSADGDPYIEYGEDY